MTWRERFLRIPHIWFLALLLIQLLPDAKEGDYYPAYVIGSAVILELFYLLVSLLSRKKETISETGKLLSVVEILVLLWVLFGSKLDRLNAKMFPAPGIVFHQFIEDTQPLLAAVWISLRTILEGFLLALVIAVPMGLILGWFKAVRSTASYVVRFVSAIPPITPPFPGRAWGRRTACRCCSCDPPLTRWATSAVRRRPGRRRNWTGGCFGSSLFWKSSMPRCLRPWRGGCRRL